MSGARDMPKGTEAEMIYVKRSEWDRLESRGVTSTAIFDHEHDGTVCKAGERMVKKGRLTRNPGDYSTLIFEHIHFEIVEG